MIAIHHGKKIMNIMVCFDETEAAKAAISVTESRAKMPDAKVFVVMSMAGGPDIPKEEFEKREADLAEVRRRFRRQDLSCESILLVRRLEPGQDLVEFAEANAIDEIVIGIKRRSKVGKLLFGSTAQYVILEARCPVLTVKTLQR